MKYHGDALFEVMVNANTVAKTLGMDKLEKSEWVKTILEEVNKIKVENADFAAEYVHQSVNLTKRIAVECRPKTSRPIGECLSNAVLEFGETGNRIVAGYCLTHPFGDVNSVFWHFWNQDKNGNNYDTTNIGLKEGREVMGMPMEWTHRQVVDFIQNRNNQRQIHDPHDWFTMKVKDNTYAILKKPWGAPKGSYTYVEIAGVEGKE
jgi:hypothetical protein